MGLSRQDRRKLRAALHRQKTKPADPATCAGERLRLMGKLAYLAMLNKGAGRGVRVEVVNLGCRAGAPALTLKAAIKREPYSELRLIAKRSCLSSSIFKSCGSPSTSTRTSLPLPGPIFQAPDFTLEMSVGPIPMRLNVPSLLNFIPARPLDGGSGKSAGR